MKGDASGAEIILGKELSVDSVLEKISLGCRETRWPFKVNIHGITSA